MTSCHNARRSPIASVEISLDDPRAEDVRELLAIHLAFSRGVTPAEFSFALDEEQLLESGTSFFSARRSGELVGIAALRRTDDTHVELKSMHTRQSDRGNGIGRAMLDYVLNFARERGDTRISLETGTTDDFLGARRLYTKAGFEPCGPFGNYSSSPYNTFMTITLDS